MAERRTLDGRVPWTMVLDVDVGLGDDGSELRVLVRHDHCFRGEASASTHHRRHLLLFGPASATSALRLQSRPERTHPSIHASPLRTIDLSPCRDPDPQPPSAQDILTRNFSLTDSTSPTPTRSFTTFLVSMLHPQPVTEGR